MLNLKHYVGDNLKMSDARGIVELVNSVWPAESKSIDELVGELVSEHAIIPGHEIFVIWDGDIAIAHAAVFARDISWDGGGMTVMAMEGVCVSPESRGMGFGKQIVQVALGLVDKGQYKLSLFQTGIPDFYRTFGAVSVDNEFWNSQGDESQASPWWDPFVMIYPDFKGWPSKIIDLNGKGY